MGPAGFVWRPIALQVRKLFLRTPACLWRKSPLALRDLALSSPVHELSDNNRALAYHLLRPPRLLVE
jgi:hypothetical protein